MTTLTESKRVMNGSCSATMDSQLEPLIAGESPDPSSVRRQLEVLRWSRAFQRSRRLMAFLGHIVEAKLAGKPRLLTESAIGQALYATAHDYDARIDSTVRVEARRLRRKLDEYYAVDGADDEVIIQLPVGSYSPVIQQGQRAPLQPNGGVSNKSGSAKPIFVDAPGAAIVVLPVLAPSNAADDREFAVGLGDELIFGLAHSSGLRVVSRGAVEQMLKQNPSVEELARVLAVDAVVQASVRRCEMFMRVTLDLSDSRGYVVWSDRIELRDGERRQLQELFAATILSRLRIDSSRMRSKAIGPGPGPEALRALARIYSSRQLLDQQMPASLREALEGFRHVAETAADYARGHSGIADCHCDMYRLGMIDHAVARKMARAAAERAVAVDPESIEANGALAAVCGWLERNLPAAEQLFLKTLARGPCSRVARAYALLLTSSGRHDEAGPWLLEARQIEPLSNQQDIVESLCHFQARRYCDAVKIVEGATYARIADEALVYIALAYALSGDHENARGLMARISSQVSKHPELKYAREELDAWIGSGERARSLLDDGAPGVTCFGRATLAMAARDDAHALQALKECVTRRELSAAWVRSDARFDRLRGSAPFAEIVAALNGLSPDRLNSVPRLSHR